MIIDGKQDLDYYLKQLSNFGMATGLQEMTVSCEKVGQGSFAQVYKVITNYDSVMALKAFDKNSLRLHKNKLAFQNQIDVIKSLNSKYIATVEGLFETEKKIYLKMQYFSFSLKHYIKKNIPIKYQKRIMKQLFEGLLQMKLKNIIHRDLKPQNIMIRGKNLKCMECVIIDFGLATPANLDRYIFNRCGTPGFLAPEIAKMSNQRQKLTPACDIFSLGCIFYRILTKENIFSALNCKHVIQKNKSLIIPWQTFNKFSQNQRNLIQKMLDRDPVKRITPQQALRHPYFDQEIDDDDQIPQQGCDLMKKMKILSSVNQTMSRKKLTQSFMSSFNSNTQFTSKGSISSDVYQRIFEIKDSCLSFQGPVKGSIDSRNTDFRQSAFTASRLQKRISRFSQINQALIL